MHVPVMLGECLEYLAVRPEGAYLDSTCGLGGHTGAIARRLTTGTVWACDRDQESLERAREATADCAERIKFRQVSFSNLKEMLAAEAVTQLDGLLADLGVSKWQLTAPERGFSIMADGPLDMRLSRDSNGRTAADVVNFESEKTLAGLIFELGGERRSRKIARAIVRSRPVLTTGQLAKLIERVVPRTEKIHPATRTFMALRMEVNSEVEELDRLLDQAPGLVRPGGRIVIVTFTSTEDRAVKHRFQELARNCQAGILTRHVVRPADEEVHNNPPSRSAKLRAVEII